MMESKHYPRNVRTVGFQNVALDFKTTYVDLGRTKTGRMKLGEISGSGPEGFTVHRNRMSTIRPNKQGKKVHWVHPGGSCKNAEYYEE